jgi:hypothetical protein
MNRKDFSKRKDAMHRVSTRRCAVLLCAVFCAYFVLPETVSAQTVINVTSTDDTGTGTLRQAITNLNAGSGGTITFDASLAGQTVTLASTLPQITKDLIIEGNGITISGNNACRIIYISWSTITVTIRRVHFKNGKGLNKGGAIFSEVGADINLESCIFSGNTTAESYAWGGAVYLYDGVFNIQGCTFYNNNTFRGGAIYSNGTTTLTGNLFYENKATDAGDIMYHFYGTATSNGYNVYDIAANYNFNFSAGTDDKHLTALPFSPVSFRLLESSDAAGILPAILPSGYPAADFYGNSISGNGAAGAVQGTVATGSYLLDYGKTGKGTVAVTSGTVDTDGMAVAGTTVTLTATPATDAKFSHWTVDGVFVETQNVASLQIAMDGNKTVRAVFAYVVNSADDNTTVDAYTTLREAIEAVNSDGGGAITFAPAMAGSTVTLASYLSLYADIIIEGNGVTISGNNANRIMNIFSSNITVTIRRIHFANATASLYGAAIRNDYAMLNLQSCIFSGNRITGGTANGGAVYSGGDLHVKGCTFYNNNSTNNGGAIANFGTATLVGNIFYGNTATTNGNVIYRGGTITSGGYNIYDNTSYNFSFGANDADITSQLCPFDAATFVPVLNGAAESKLPATLPSGYPTEDFYGILINGGGSAGAVQGIAQSLIESGSYTVAQATANTEADVKTWLAGQINALSGMSATGITVTAADITVSNFTPAVAGTAGNLSGMDGSFDFTVSLVKGSSNVTTASKNGTITATPLYEISIGTFANGSVSPDKTVASQGETVTLTVMPDAGYELNTISAGDAGTPVTLSGNGNSRTFTMPAYGVTVTATFQKTADQNAVETAKSLIESGSYTVAQATANTEADVKTWLAGQINALSGMSATGITVTTADITVSNFTPAVAGTAGNLSGTDGSFDFTILLVTGYSNVTAGKNGTITATPYVNAQTPTITAQPQPANGYVGSTPTALTVTATVTDGGTLSFQWHRNATNSNTGGTAIAGSTGASYTPPTDVAGVTYYYVTVTNTAVNGSQTATTTSATAAVTIMEPVTPVIHRKVTLTASPHFSSDPAAGVYYIESHHNMVITLTPLVTQPAGFVPYVTTGRRLLPDDEGGVRIRHNSDGTYTVRIMRIQEETTVTVTTGFPVATEYIPTGRVWSYGNRLYIKSVTGDKAYIYNVSGLLVEIVTPVAGETVVRTLPAGVYVIATEGKRYKVVVGST